MSNLSISSPPKILPVTAMISPPGTASVVMITGDGSDGLVYIYECYSFRPMTRPLYHQQAYYFRGKEGGRNVRACAAPEDGDHLMFQRKVRIYE